MPQSNRPQYRSARPRPQRPRSGQFSPSPLLLWGAGGVVLLIILIVWGISALSPKESPATQTAAASQTTGALAGTPTLQPSLTPAPTATPTLTPTVTPVPRQCKTDRDTFLYSEPKQVTVKEAIPQGKSVAVYWTVTADGAAWDRVLVNGAERFIPEKDVTCN